MLVELSIGLGLDQVSGVGFEMVEKVVVGLFEDAFLLFELFC